MVVLAAFALLSGAACGHSPTGADQAEVCAGYPDWQTSTDVLPYPVGTAYRVSQGNCSPPGNGHRGSERYAYDFGMAIGTSFTAMRAGVVVHNETSHFDGQVAPTGLDNYLVIRHDDGTFGLYGHLTHDGSELHAGDTVTQGQVIGRSGNTGNTNNYPHLHVGIHVCNPVTQGSAACPTTPITFRNTEANPSGLQRDRSYVALSF
jgi:murein DD-endopeptidase MepM/ murein hydrolase activator NlpD